MEVGEAIERVEKELEVLREERDTLRDQLRTIDDQSERLAQMLVALKDIVATFGSDEMRASLEATKAEAPEPDWRNLQRTAATYRAVIEAGRPVSPADIVALLKGKGRTDDNIHVVSAALNHLRNRYKVGRIGRGQWVPYDDLPGTRTSASEELAAG
jgi:septal ring factor EnvC (AmiA/AmiB activator)